MYLVLLWLVWSDPSISGRRVFSVAKHECASSVLAFLVLMNLVAGANDNCLILLRRLSIQFAQVSLLGEASEGRSSKVVVRISKNKQFCSAVILPAKSWSIIRSLASLPKPHQLSLNS